MNTALLPNTFCCIESDSPESFTQLINELPDNTLIHNDNHAITLPDATTCYGLSIDGDRDSGIDLISLYCAQKGVIWGELSNRTLYFSDGNVVDIESCSIREVA